MAPYAPLKDFSNATPSSPSTRNSYGKARARSNGSPPKPLRPPDTSFQPTSFNPTLPTTSYDRFYQLPSFTLLLGNNSSIQPRTDPSKSARTYVTARLASLLAAERHVSCAHRQTGIVNGRIAQLHVTPFSAASLDLAQPTLQPAAAKPMQHIAAKCN